MEKLEFPEGRGGGIFCGLILENPGGRGGYMKNPFRWGGMDIFWNHTMYSIQVYISHAILSSSLKVSVDRDVTKKNLNMIINKPRRLYWTVHL